MRCVNLQGTPFANLFNFSVTCWHITQILNVYFALFLPLCVNYRKS